MTLTWVYIGELGENGALDWGGDPKVGNVPKKMLDLPGGGAGGRSPWHLLIDWINAGKLVGQKVDWGSWAARATSAELITFLETCYGADAIGAPRFGVAPVAAFARAMPADKQIALVATEL